MNEQSCQIIAFLEPKLLQCHLFFLVFAFCFLCLLDDTNDGLVLWLTTLIMSSVFCWCIRRLFLLTASNSDVTANNQL